MNKIKKVILLFVILSGFQGQWIHLQVKQILKPNDIVIIYGSMMDKSLNVKTTLKDYRRTKC